MTDPQGKRGRKPKGVPSGTVRIPDDLLTMIERVIAGRRDADGRKATVGGYVETIIRPVVVAEYARVVQREYDELGGRPQPKGKRP